MTRATAMAASKGRKPSLRQEAISEDTAPERLRALANDPKLARLVAAHPSAPAELLLELSRSDDKAVRKACTSNANTPVEALLKLGSQFPEQLLENPVFGLLLLGHPGLFEELPTSTLNSLLKRDQVPVELIRWAWTHRGESTIHSLLMNPHTPADVVMELCKLEAPEVRMAAELHCTNDLPEWALKLTESTNLEKQTILYYQLVIRSNQTCPQILIELLELGDTTLQERCIRLFHAELKESIALNRKTGAELLALLAEDKNPRVRQAVARNRKTPAEALTLLATDKAEWVRQAVAENRHTPAEVLVLLAKDRRVGFRKALAGNCQTPAKVLGRLAKDQSWSVREAVAKNSTTPGEALTLLATDLERDVRRAVARNSKIPTELLSLLATDQDKDVRLAVAGRYKAPGEVLTLLATDQDKDIRQAVAENSKTPTELLTLLATDQDKDVRLAVAGRCRRSEEALTLLATDQDQDLPKAVAKTRNTPRRINSELREALLVQICTDGCKGSQPSPGRRFLFTLPQCPANLLAKNFRSRSWLERFAIAGNPSTPEAVLEQMANEGNQLVRRAATANLAARAKAVMNGSTEEVVKESVPSSDGV